MEHYFHTLVFYYWKLLFCLLLHFVIVELWQPKRLMMRKFNSLAEHICLNFQYYCALKI